jgi:hypothetical protein
MENTKRIASEDLQGLKPGSHFVAFTARMNSCPVTERSSAEFFSQPV